MKGQVAKAASGGGEENGRDLQSLGTLALYSTNVKNLSLFLQPVWPYQDNCFLDGKL